MISKQTVIERIAALRSAMTTAGVSALIVPSADPHMSEYLPDYWQGRRHFSGFTGSVGTLVVGMDFAHVWVDSRYWIQAAAQLEGTGIALKKIETGQPTHGEYLAAHLPADSVVAVDGMTLSVTAFERLQNLLADKGIALDTQDLLADVWTDRPAMPFGEVYVHAACFVSETAAQKLARVRAAMREKGATHHLICSLDDIAWLSNLRGQDVDCNPVFLAHLLIAKDSAHLYVDENKLNDAAKLALTDAGISIAAYDDLADGLAQVSGSLLFDPDKVATGSLSALNDAVTQVRAMNPSTLMKAVKSAADLDHVRVAMAQDGAALCEFFAELEHKLAAGERVTEVDIDGMLIDARARQPHFVGTSFDSIVGFRGNGAMAHYRATEDSHSVLEGDGLLLIDSGAQYENGTTDITRMVGIGQVSEDAKRDVTYVLKAHIALAQAVFPVGLPSPMLDMIARQPMWRAGLNYGHGTGHGVGYFMNVHEGPQVIAYNAPITPERTMLTGMITSNEPGIYRAGQWGVRIENLVATTPAFKTEFGEFLRFEDLTLCPIDTRIILPEMLSAEEKTWLNSYHDKVRQALLPRVEGAARDWLMARTTPLA